MDPKTPNQPGKNPQPGRPTERPKDDPNRPKHSGDPTERERQDDSFRHSK